MAFTGSGLSPAATAEDTDLSKSVPQIDNIINHPQPTSTNEAKIASFDAMIVQANKEYADEQNRLAIEAAQQLAEAAVQRQTQAVQTAGANGSCATWMASAGISDPANAYPLIMRESGCNPGAVNASSGACGIGQQLPCGKWPHQWNDPVGGLIDMQNYVYASYGSWANAWYHELTYGWY